MSVAGVRDGLGCSCVASYRRNKKTLSVSLVALSSVTKLLKRFVQKLNGAFEVCLALGLRDFASSKTLFGMGAQVRMAEVETLPSFC